MAGPAQSGWEGPGGDPGVVVAKRARQRRAATELIRRRKRPLIAIGAPAQEPIQQTTVPRVGMSHDPWKASVRCASTANVAITTGLEAGDSVDGVTLAAGDRVLLKNQTDAKQNGIYVAVQSGAASRAADAVDGTHYLHAVVGVQQGTINGNHFFVCFTDAPIVIGSTNMAWTDMGSLMGLIDGSQVQDGTIEIAKLLGSGVSTGAMLYCDGSSWVVLEPPSVASHLTHPGGTGAPEWTAI